MRSMQKMSSEPNLFGAKPRGNKAFPPTKSTSSTCAASSYKLSSKVRNILSTDLNRSSSHSDASVQPMNARRRAQRRGSKSASMFKALSTGNMMSDLYKIDDSKQEQVDQNNTEVILNSLGRLSTDSTRGCLSSLGESMSSFSSDMDDSLEFA